MLIVSFVLITPTYVTTVLSPIEEDIKKGLSDASMETYITEYFAPMISLVINFGMIPSMIDLFAVFEDYRRKSSL